MAARPHHDGRRVHDQHDVWSERLIDIIGSDLNGHVLEDAVTDWSGQAYKKTRSSTPSRI